MSRITEWLQAAGEFTIDLAEAVPQDVLEAIGPWDHIVIFDQRLDPTRFDDSALKGMARYAGVITSPPQSDATAPRRIAGHGLAFHLGDRDGVGDIFEDPVTLVDGTFEEWVLALLPAGGSIIIGNVFSVTADTQALDVDATAGTDAHTDLDFGDDLDVRVRVRPADWTPATDSVLISK